MSGKLVIHKFESGVSFKSLHITIEDGADTASKVVYSDWSEGNENHKESGTKSARLVVKIVAGNEDSRFNLDACAHEINQSDVTSQGNGPYNSFHAPIFRTTECDKDPNENKISFKILNFNGTTHTSKSISTVYDVNKNTVGRPSLCPLEYSLERVKESNARILENIHMLNRTLNYTQTREFDIVCPKSLRSYPCNVCGKCFVYETGLKRHYSMRHSVAEAAPRWQVVWTCVECFQVWPRHDLAERHAARCSSTADHAEKIREIKASSLLQCEFCEKVYTNIPRLLRHAKVHNTINNYVCNPCHSAYDSYKAVEQHWMECTWQKTCYTFSLPKLWLCNACDRKFRNYEQLYNHRYKVGHFMTKMLESQVTSNGIFVYQCELCATWFPSIQGLQDHRHQVHSCYNPGL